MLLEKCVWLQEITKPEAYTDDGFFRVLIEFVTAL